MPWEFGGDEVLPGVRCPQVKQAVHRLGECSAMTSAHDRPLSEVRAVGLEGL